MKLRKIAAIASLLCASVAAQAQDIQERTIRFGHQVQPGHPIAIGTQKLAELVAQRSGGKLQVKEFGGGVLGGEQQQLGSVQGGIQEMTMPSATVMGGVVKDFSVLDTPFTFASGEQVDALLGGPFGKALMDKLTEKGLIGLAFWETGFRQFTNNRKPLQTADDLKGLKVRVIGNPLMLESFKALGTNPVPMPFPELFGALESKAMDAQENPFSIILTSRFFEVQKYLSVTNHVYTANPVVISKRVWDRMSAAEQKIIREAVIEAGAYQRKVSRDAAGVARKELESKGMLVNDVPETTLAKMRELTKPVGDKFAATYDPALMQLFHSEMARIQASVR